MGRVILLEFGKIPQLTAVLSTKEDFLGLSFSHVINDKLVVDQRLPAWSHLDCSVVQYCLVCMMLWVPYPAPKYVNK
jgi:hypothetical protein